VTLFAPEHFGIEIDLILQPGFVKGSIINLIKNKIINLIRFIISANMRKIICQEIFSYKKANVTIYKYS